MGGSLIGGVGVSHFFILLGGGGGCPLFLAITLFFILVADVVYGGVGRLSDFFPFDNILLVCDVFRFITMF